MRSLADGNHTWSVRARDALGLISATSGPYALVVDALLPTVPATAVVAPTDGEATWPTTLATGLANGGSFVWSVGTLNTTKERIKARATDLAGNLAEDASDASFTNDSTLPTQPGAPAGVPNPCDGLRRAPGARRRTRVARGLAGYRLERSADAGST